MVMTLILFLEMSAPIVCFKCCHFGVTLPHWGPKCMFPLLLGVHTVLSGCQLAKGLALHCTEFKVKGWQPQAPVGRQQTDLKAHCRLPVG